MIDGFHSNWTKPFYDLNDNNEYYIEDYEILTTILSALKWRQYNGSIKMITDNIGAEYYKSLNIESIWDKGIEVVLDKIDNSIDSNIFWAAGKIYAMDSQIMPSVMIDTDFIVWQSIERLLIKSNVCTIHKENIIEDIYPGKTYFKMNDNYTFDEKWDWDVLPCNTALTYISDNDFKEYYTKSSINFMKNLKSSNNRLINMVFAEQRLIAMCAKKYNISIEEIMPLDKLYSNQKLFTHIWGYKDEMKRDYNKRKEFCIKCINRILSDFPEYEDIIANISSLNEYYKASIR